MGKERRAEARKGRRKKKRKEKMRRGEWRQELRELNKRMYTNFLLQPENLLLKRADNDLEIAIAGIFYFLFIQKHF